MIKLSQKEEKVLDYLIKKIGEDGYAPSVRDIARDLDIKSTSSVHAYLQGLERAGCIEQETGKRRTLRLCAPYSMGVGRIPLVGRITAGAPILAVENFEGYVDLPWSRIKYPSEELFALKVKGESMIDAGILDGDIVIVHKDSYAENGDIVIALIDDEATVKTFYRENGTYRLQPENRTMKPILLKELTVLGRVIASFREY